MHRICSPVAGVATLAALALAAACSSPAGPAGRPSLATPTATPAGAATLSAPDGLARPAAARIDDVVDTLHGTAVHDPYRWMERGGPAFEAFLDEQNAYSRAVVAAIPGRDELRAAIADANRGTTRIGIGGVRGASATPRIFLWKRAPDDGTSQIWLRQGWSGADKLLIDPRPRDQGEVHYALNYAVASPDGKYLAYGIAAAGSEDSVIEILEVDTGRVLPEKIDRAQYAHISWRDSSSFFYWRRRAPAPTDAPGDWLLDSATYLHKLGDDPERAQPVISPMMKELGLPPETLTSIAVSPNSRWALATASPGTSADVQYFVAPVDEVVPGKTPWRRLTGPSDGVTYMVAYGDTLYAYSYAGAPRYRILSFDARTGTLAKAKVFVPEGEAILEDFFTSRDAMYLQLFDGGKTRIERLSYDGKRRESVPLPYDASVSIYGEQARPGIFLSVESWTVRAREYLYEPERGLRDLALREPWPIDYSHLTSELVEVRSADGTLVPMSIIHRKDAPRDGSTPALLESYQAYGGTEKPWFWPLLMGWVNHGSGAIAAYCHGRGTGNRGKQWHLDGIKHNKERGVEDLLACAEYLVSQKLTSPARLTVTGTSAGGMVVGGAITRRPELFTAAILRVPMINILRFETAENENSRTNIPELGTAADPDDFRALLASDPYHRLTQGARLPALLVTGGKQDVRVPIWQQAKFVARAQATSGSGRPILFRVESEGGHFGSSEAEEEEEWADLYAFALWQSGVPIAEGRP